jgi:hypothetical protein
MRQRRVLWRLLLGCAVVATMPVVRWRAAFADMNDAGDDASAATDGGALDDAYASDSSAPAPPVALACDGALCDTTNSSACTAGSRIGSRATGVDLTAGLTMLLAVAMTRRGRRRQELQP